MAKSFFSRFQQPNSRFRRNFSLGLLVVLLVAASLIAFEKYRNVSLNKSVDKLRASIIDKNIKISEYSTNCFAEKNQLMGNAIGRSCMLNMTIRPGEVGYEEANYIVGSVYDSAGDIDDFVRKGSKPVVDKMDSKSRLNGTQLKHKSTGRTCSIGYHLGSQKDADKENTDLWINFSCDVTSWLTRTFGI